MGAAHGGTGQFQVAYSGRLSQTFTVLTLAVNFGTQNQRGQPVSLKGATAPYAHPLNLLLSPWSTPMPLKPPQRHLKYRLPLPPG